MCLLIVSLIIFFISWIDFGELNVADIDISPLEENSHVMSS